MMMRIAQAASVTPAPDAMSPTLLIDIGLMAMLVVVAFAIVRMRSLFAIVMLQGVYSLLSAAWFVSLDAVDVAFTEAAVGAGISTVLMLGAMLLTDRQSAPVPVRKAIGPLLVVMLAGAAMFYAIPDMPAYGDANSPANTGPGMEYMTSTVADVEIPNVVTAVLASYRGYDTMGETVVIFMAGLGVLLLLGLNGNAGRWRAQVQGQNLCSHMAPQALVLESLSDEPLREPLAPEAERPPEPKPAPKPSPVKKAKAPAKTAAKAKTVAKTSKPAAKTATSKKAAAKKAATKTITAKKTRAKTATTKKPVTKAAAPKKPISKKTVTKNVAAQKTSAKTKKPPTKGAKS